MRKKTYKGRCEKRKLEKFEGICKTYDPIQYAYADILSAREDVVSVRCNVWLDGEECSEYMPDFLCTLIEAPGETEQYKEQKKVDDGYA